ncbi:hypothetical protein ACLOJK_001422, partial [Asimina triloba]
QFNKMEHLVEHMRISFHSVHEPTCGTCKKHCRSFESLREHLIVLKKGTGLASQMSRLNIYYTPERDNHSGRRANAPQALALACKVVGGGNDGSLDLCGRVCLMDEDEKIIFQTYVKPNLPVTNYRYETTGIRPEYLRDAMPLKQVGRKIQDILCNGEALWKIRTRAGKARILVGHGLDRDLQCLDIEYPAHLLRDTAKYPPLMKTSKLSNSLKYLTQAYLGYEIQTGIQDPCEDCAASIRLYTRMRSQVHPLDETPSAGEYQSRNNFPAWRQRELERMSPDQLLEISRSDYYCWCLDLQAWDA